MTNLIGAEVEDVSRWLAVPDTSIHLYGKRGARPGRKMGHVTRVFTDLVDFSARNCYTPAPRRRRIHHDGTPAPAQKFRNHDQEE